MLRKPRFHSIALGAIAAVSIACAGNIAHAGIVPNQSAFSAGGSIDVLAGAYPSSSTNAPLPANAALVGHNFDFNTGTNDGIGEATGRVTQVYTPTTNGPLTTFVVTGKASGRFDELNSFPFEGSVNAISHFDMTFDVGSPMTVQLSGVQATVANSFAGTIALTSHVRLYEVNGVAGETLLYEHAVQQFTFGDFSSPFNELINLAGGGTYRFEVVATADASFAGVIAGSPEFAMSFDVQMAVIPVPSAALIVTLGLTGLTKSRRRR